MNLMAATHPPHLGASLRSLGPRQLPLCAAGIGAAGGLLATIYYLLLQGLLHGIWLKILHRPLNSLSIEPHFSPLILLVTSVGGLLVGLLTRWLGSAGEIAAVVDNIHLREGRIDMRQTPAMTVTSLVSIAAGGSAGPEAPLVQINDWVMEFFALAATSRAREDSVADNIFIL